VGSGAGFPSLPLKILSPHLDLVIFESQRKKADFLRCLVDSLDLKGVEVINERAERYTGQCFDLVLFKAVGKIRALVGLVDKLLAPGGTAIFYKTPHVELEIKSATEELRSRNLCIEVKRLVTPVARLPVALVLLSRK
jgi:16S rRNA (guanine527-N7)-methyltransferase